MNVPFLLFRTKTVLNRVLAKEGEKRPSTVLTSMVCYLASRILGIFWPKFSTWESESPDFFRKIYVDLWKWVKKWPRNSAKASARCSSRNSFGQISSILSKFQINGPCKFCTVYDSCGVEIWIQYHIGVNAVSTEKFLQNLAKISFTKNVLRK